MSATYHKSNARADGIGNLAARKERELRERAACNHEPSRVYTWTAREIANDPASKLLMCFGCCDCGHSWEVVAPSWMNRNAR